MPLSETLQERRFNSDKLGNDLFQTKKVRQKLNTIYTYTLNTYMQ